MRATMIICASSMGEIIDVIISPLLDRGDFEMSIPISDILAVSGGEAIQGYMPGDQFLVEVDSKLQKVIKVMKKK